MTRKLNALPAGEVLESFFLQIEDLILEAWMARVTVSSLSSASCFMSASFVSVGNRFFKSRSILFPLIPLVRKSNEIAGFALSEALLPATKILNLEHMTRPQD